MSEKSEPTHQSQLTSPAEPKKPGSSSPTSEASSRLGLLAFTVDADTAEIVKLESVDSFGARHELSDEEKAKLAIDKKDKLETLFEQTFEAGIACVLGGAVEHYDPRESKEDEDLRHFLIRSLMKKSPATDVLRRDVISRAALQTLIEDTIKGRSSGQKGSSTSRI